MKKDKFIQNKLYEYIDNIKPPYEIIADAVVIVKKREKNNYSRTSGYRFFKAFAAIAAAVIVLVLAFNLFSGKPGDTVIKYDITDLGRMSIELSQVKQINENIRLLENEQMSVECYSFFDRSTGKELVISLKYKISSESGIDEVYIFADMKKGLTSFEEFKDYTEKNIGSVSIFLNEYYRNGEFYTNAYFNANNIDYYVIIMSPGYGQGKYYLENLIL